MATLFLSLSVLIFGEYGEYGELSEFVGSIESHLMFLIDGILSSEWRSLDLQSKFPFNLEDVCGVKTLFFTILEFIVDNLLIFLGLLLATLEATK